MSEAGRLLTRQQIMEEFGLTRHAAETVMRHLPKVQLPGIRRSFVKKADVERLIRESTRAA